MLNDYDAKGDYIGVITDGLTLDLNSKTYTVSSNKAIGVNQANVGLTIKNGKIENKTGDGAEVGVGYDNCSLTLENVELVAARRLWYCYQWHLRRHANTDKRRQCKSAQRNRRLYALERQHPAGRRRDISGNTGIAIKGGTLTVKNGSTVQGTGVANIPDTPESSGVSDTGDAIYVEGNYGFEIQLQLEGGVL